MKDPLPYVVVRIAVVIWMFVGPLHVLGAMLSKMNTEERYFTQLGIASAIFLAAVCAAFGVKFGRPWARWLLIVITWPMALFWLSGAYAIGDALAGAIGVAFLLMVSALHLSENSPSVKES